MHNYDWCGGRCWHPHIFLFSFSPTPKFHNSCYYSINATESDSRNSCKEPTSNAREKADDFKWAAMQNVWKRQTMGEEGIQRQFFQRAKYCTFSFENLCLCDLYETFQLLQYGHGFYQFDQCEHGHFSPQYSEMSLGQVWGGIWTKRETILLSLSSVIFDLSSFCEFVMGIFFSLSLSSVREGVVQFDLCEREYLFTSVTGVTTLATRHEDWRLTFSQPPWEVTSQ